MEKLNLWCRLVASVSVISSLMSLVIPESSIKKTFNTLMCIILVFSLIHPLSGGKTSVLSFADKINGFDFKNRDTEINDYSQIALIYAAETEAEKYIENLIGKCKCKVICNYDGETVQIVNINIEGEFDDGEIMDYYTEIIKICGDCTVIEFNGERYERK